MFSSLSLCKWPPLPPPTPRQIPLSESNIGVTHALDVLARIVQRHPELSHIPADEHLVCAMVPRKRGEDGEPLLDKD